MLVQLLVAAGNPVVATSSAARADYLAGLGATPVVYADLPARLDIEHPNGFAASIDLAGSAAGGRDRRRGARAGGKAVTIVPATTQSHGIPLIQVQRSQARLTRLLADAADGTLQMPVETLPLKEIVEVHRRLDARHAVGKTVLDLSDNPHLPEA